MAEGTNTERTTLYRAYGADAQLLYIGIARNWPRRWAQHAERSAWFSSVTRVDVQEHDTRASALDAEKAAIADEKPLHNVQHTNGRTPPRKSTSPAAADRITLVTEDAGLEPSSLIGSFFHSGADPGWQGCVVAEPRPGVYLVELFGWLMGDSTLQSLVPIERMVDEGWSFYDDSSWMNNAYERYIEHRWEREREPADA